MKIMIVLVIVGLIVLGVAWWGISLITRAKNAMSFLALGYIPREERKDVQRLGNLCSINACDRGSIRPRDDQDVGGKHEHKK